jgi:hypothetical protein
MKRKVLSTIAAASLLAASGAMAESFQLSGDQMDGVTAGGIADALASAAALGGALASTYTETSTVAQGVVFVPVQVGGVWVVGTAASSYAEAFASN